MEPRLPGGESAYFFAVNRTKQSIAIDLKSESGRMLVLDLIPHVDIVVENFLPGTLSRMGLGFSELTEANPRLVLISNTGFGQTGPEAGRKGYDTVFQALSGVMHVTGHPDAGPAKVGVPIADMTSSLWVMIAALVGLLDRHRTGHGGHWDVAMMDVQASLLSIGAARLFAHDEDPQRTGTEHPGRVPSAALRCADGRWVHISASDQHWSSLCQVLNLRPSEVDRWSTNAQRVAERGAVMERLQEIAGTWKHNEFVDALHRVGVPAGLVQSPREALTSDQARHRGSVQSFVHATEGEFCGISTPLRRVGDQAPDVAPPPLLGGDTEAVLSSLLGLSADQIGDLSRRGVVQTNGRTR